MQVGFLNLLTIVFIVLKLTETISWSWWLVLAPTLVSIILAFLIVVLAIWLQAIK